MKGIRDGCISELGEVGGMMYGADYDDHTLNYELHFKKKQISFDVFLMVFRLDVTVQAFNP